MITATITDTETMSTEGTGFSCAQVVARLLECGGTIRDTSGSRPSFRDELFLAAAVGIIRADIDFAGTEHRCALPFRIVPVKGGRQLELTTYVGMGATNNGWTDRHPYEVVRVVSDRCLEVRAMDSTCDGTWKQNFEPGGFVGHTYNDHERKWILTSNPANEVIKIRRLANGRWHGSQGDFSVGKAIKFYDSNF
ncbi:hypothetical protein UFOVP141_26 [uncultured Caudovirales phage]|uniref:Uncharacterized protein n=1 Tax=uncultured Caudovirales phage TaxID=2100421 RepID=A0A6J7VPP3_9CAUD|nr:hypothetical protein UFOVP141_26 [uncultured Caudovirales phage]